MLDHTERTLRRESIARHWVETRIESDIVVGRVETGMVKQVKEIRRVLQVEALRDPRVLEHGEIHA